MITFVFLCVCVVLLIVLALVAVCSGLRSENEEAQIVCVLAAIALAGGAAACGTEAYKAAQRLDEAAKVAP